MQFFSTCATIDEVKKEYRKLSFLHHPDKGGDLETMQLINRLYSEAIKMVQRGENISTEERESTIFEAEEYRQAIEKIIHLEGITIEVVGTWIWVTDTNKDDLNQRETLKGAGYFWAHKKVAWYFRTSENKSKNRTKMSLDQVRAKYGSEKVQGKSFSKLKSY